MEFHARSARRGHRGGAVGRLPGRRARTRPFAFPNGDGNSHCHDTRAFVAAVRARGVTPHVARNERGRRSAIDGRTTRHAGSGRSLRRRKLVEEVFGWLKTVGGGRKLRYLGRERNRAWLELTAAAYNLVRLSRLEPVAA